MRKDLFSAVVIVAVCTMYFALFSGCGIEGGGVVIGSPGHPPPKSGPPPWAPAHGYRAKHRYRYYPKHYVYFDLTRKVYFYLDGDRWKVSVHLPGRIDLAYASYVTLEMETDKPYEHFSEHKRKYPPGQMKKKNKHKKK
ncbi:MAG: hypothetical protein JRJ26_12080 [Deltaproteobacteria bacterium]|nr:hypothetical protein [Deltaproteobacteria bacterium]